MNNLEVAEPCVEVISQKEIIKTNEVAMSVDIASDFDQNQVSKSKFPVDTSENMDIWNEIDAIIEQADNEEDLVVAESIIQEVQTAVINPDVPEFPFRCILSCYPSTKYLFRFSPLSLIFMERPVCDLLIISTTSRSSKYMEYA